MAFLQYLTQPLRPQRILSVGIVTLALCSSSQPLLAESNTDEKDGDSVKGAFPTLDILPEGSILRRVRLPRYDEGFVPISLLTAETMTVLDKDRIDGLGITIHLYAKDGSIDARTKMRHAIYNQKLSTLHASEAIFIEGRSYLANGTGMVFDWKSNRGFLLGPAITKFKKSPPKKTTTMQIKPSYAPRAIASSLVVMTSLTTSAIAEPPAKLTAEQIAEFDHLTQPMKHEIEQHQQEIQRTLDEDARLSNEAHAEMGPFLTSIGQGNLLVQTNPSAKPADKAPKVAEKPPAEAKPKAPKADPKAPPVETLKVICDGGIYFDTDTGVLAYLKNIRLTETGPTATRFHLTCTDELKVFLEKKEKKKEDVKKATPKPEKAAAPEASKTTEKTPDTSKATTPDPKKTEEKKEDAKKDDLTESFGDLQRIIATGKVKVTRKDEQGRLFIATAESASYNAKTGEMILRGGMPRLQLGTNRYLQSKSTGEYIRILENGKFITSEGTWVMETPLKGNQPKKPTKKKAPAAKKPTP